MTLLLVSCPFGQFYLWSRVNFLGKLWVIAGVYQTCIEMSEMSMRCSTKWFTFETWWWCCAMAAARWYSQMIPRCYAMASSTEAQPPRLWLPPWLVWPLEPWAHPSFLPGRTGIAPVFPAAQPKRQPNPHQQRPIFCQQMGIKSYMNFPQTSPFIRVYHSKFHPILGDVSHEIPWNPHSYPIKSTNISCEISWLNLTYLTMAFRVWVKSLGTHD